MATAITEQIAAIVATRLAAISTGSGYETTVSGGVIRPTRLGGFQPKDYQIVFKQGDQEPMTEHDHPGNPPAVAWKVPFLIRGVLRTSELTSTAEDTLKNEFEADVRKSLAAGVAWWNFSGLAIDSGISGAEPYVSDDGTESGFQVTLDVTYRVSENDPYVSRT